MADIRQVFDLNEDPQAKQTLLSGAFNIVQCPYCGYQGQAETPIVYHDPEKELLLTYFPPTLGQSRDEQERALGNLLNQIINRLPQEKRKAYLLQPQTMLTLQGLIERILEADGITKEMLKAQEDRLRLIQRLLSASGDDVRKVILEQEKDLVDADFFLLLERLLEAAAVGGDRQSAEALAAIHKMAVENTPYGQKLKAQSEALKEVEQALKELGPRPTLDQVVDLVIQTKDDFQLQALVGALAPVMDYAFFQRLSERIEAAEGEEKERLEALRTRLLELRQEMDKLLAAEMEARQKAVEKVLQADDVEKALQEVLPYVDEVFLSLLEQALQEARQKGDLQRSARINEVLQTLEKLLAPPPELALIQALLDAPDADARQKLLEENRDQVNEALVQQMAALVAQLQQQGAPAETVQRAHEAYQQALRFYTSHTMHL
ncbi:MAG: hypothetical protein GXO56_04490 [Chloroflexi bacterium]|nr:hypothetical protein [Chloroflexota bacterium]